MVNSILHWYNQANDDDKKAVSWYREAHKLAQKHPMGVECGAAILAAYSINESWEKNKRHFTNEISGIVPRCMEMSKAKAAQIHEAVSLCEIGRLPSILNGQKIRCFYANILNPSEFGVVTIDRHALKVAGIDAKKPTKKQYLAASEAYCEAAKVVGLLPHELQAVTWVCYRRLTGKAFYG
jgi:hypothetical protein